MLNGPIEYWAIRLVRTDQIKIWINKTTCGWSCMYTHTYFDYWPSYRNLCIPIHRYVCPGEYLLHAARPQIHSHRGISRFRAARQFCQLPSETLICQINAFSRSEPARRGKKEAKGVLRYINVRHFDRIGPGSIAGCATPRRLNNLNS